MRKKCETVIISDKAYNAIIRESFARHPVETGGILLGYILDNGLWVVMEMIPPGINGVFQPAYFEYDQDFVNYLGTSIANQYKEPLQVLGLWHRHPGSMDYFSSTDDGTNSEFASRNPYGVISGLVNIDPSFRLTMYHLDHNEGVRPRNIAYSNVDVEVGDDLIPEKFFALRYVDDQRSELHPKPTRINTQVSQTRNIPKSQRNGSEEEIEESAKAEVLDQPAIQEGMPSEPVSKEKISGEPQSVGKKRRWLWPAIAVCAFAAGIFVGVMATPLVNKMEAGTTKTDVKKKMESSPRKSDPIKPSVAPTKAKPDTDTETEKAPGSILPANPINTSSVSDNTPSNTDKTSPNGQD